MAMHLNYGFDSFSGLFFCLWNSGILYLTISEITKQCLYWRKFRQTDSLKTTLAVKILNLKTKMMNCLTQHGFRPFYRWTIFLFLLLRNRAILYLIISVIFPRCWQGNTFLVYSIYLVLEHSKPDSNEHMKRPFQVPHQKRTLPFPPEISHLLRHTESTLWMGI